MMNKNNFLRGPNETMHGFSLDKSKIVVVNLENFQKRVFLHEF